MKPFNGTPGPWIYSSISGEVKHSEDGPLASVNDISEQEFNGNLIAASPDLLAALTGLLEIYDDHSGKIWTTASKRRALDAAHEAVKLALGEKE